MVSSPVGESCCLAQGMFCVLRDAAQEEGMRELEKIEILLSQSECSQKILLRSKSELLGVSGNSRFKMREGSFRERVCEMIARVQRRIDQGPTHFDYPFSSWDPHSINLQILSSAFPSSAKEISTFIGGRGLELCKESYRERKSFSVSACVDQNTPIIKYRLRNNAPQVLVYQEIGEGTYKTVQKVVVVAGSLIEEAPGPIFARFKLKEEWKKKPSLWEAVLRMARFENEITTKLCRKGIKHIVEYSIVSQKEEKVTLASALYKENLNQCLQKCPWWVSSQEYALKYLTNIAIPMAEALIGMHSEGFVHLDFKLDNILLTEEGKSYLGDFGSCRAAFSCYTCPHTTILVAAPETFENGGKWQVLPALDMWAFGLMLASLFLGPDKGCVFSNPTAERFSSLTPEDVLKEIKDGVSRIQGEFKKKILFLKLPVELFDFLSKLLSLNPLERPTGEQTLVVLQKIVEVLSGR